MKMTITSLRGLAGLLACGFLGWTAPACSDAVNDWNAIANTAVAAGRPGPSGVLDLALVQAAVHDAVQATDRRYEPYFAEVPGATGRKSAAVAAAAHDVLLGFYPADLFPTVAGPVETAYLEYIANNGLEGDPGLAVGQQVAAAIVPLRRVAPVPPPPDFTGGTNPGEWRPTPPAFLPMAVPFVADANPFTLTGAARFLAPPPPALTSDVYTRDYNEVKALGGLASTVLTTVTRTPQQTDIGHFWSENFLAQWNRAIRGITAKHVHNIGDNARLFALANLAAGDAFITSWNSKVHYNFWRPITAINEGENDGNPNTAGDPAWVPLIATPPYPDYTSGANNLSGAFTKTLALYFHRNNFTFDVTSNAPLAVQKTRTFKKFSQASDQVVEARIYLGIHFRTADKAAQKQGRQAAAFVFDHFLLPIPGNSQAGLAEQE